MGTRIEAVALLHSVRDAAGILGVSTFSVRRLIDGGFIRSVNIGGRRLISSDELQRVMTHGTGRPRPRKSVTAGPTQPRTPQDATSKLTITRD
jgi:excisionase family DNA binding protein